MTFSKYLCYVNIMHLLKQTNAVSCSNFLRESLKKMFFKNDLLN